jgi:thymidylate kinase
LKKSGKNKLEVPFEFQYTECMKNKYNITNEIERFKKFMNWCEENFENLSEEEQEEICDIKNDPDEIFNW